MSSPASAPTPGAVPPPVAASLAPAAPADLDRSCRWPVLVLGGLSAGWLVFAAVLGVLAAIKLHAPGMLANIEWLTYGRVQPAAWNALVFGFGALAGLALALWLMVRLSGVPLAGTGTILFGAAVWQVGLKLGVLGVLAGDSTGIEGLELPRYASPLLLAGYLLIAPWALVVFGRRQRRESYISQWYLVTALLVFPWCFASGYVLTSFLPLRGVLQAAAQAWYLQQLWVLWFGSLTLAALFYFLPKLTGAAVPSRSLALFGFWTFVAFGGLGGLTRYAGGPFPAWMLSLAVVGNVLTLFAIYGVGANLLPSLRAALSRLSGNVVLWFLGFSLLAWLTAGVLTALNSLATVRHLTHFTLVTPGLDQLAFLGGFGVAALGGLYVVVPCLLGRDWPSRFLATLHFGCAAGAVVLLAVAFLVGGLVHGAALNNTDVAFLTVAKRYLPFASTGTLAQLLWLVGSGAFAVNFLWLLGACARTICVPAARALVEPLPAEGKA